MGRPSSEEVVGPVRNAILDPQCDPRTDRRLTLPGSAPRLRRPVPDPPLRPEHARRGDDGSPAARARGMRTTDQLRTRPTKLSACPRSTTDINERSFTLSDRKGPIWGSRGREFKSRQPDRAKYLVRQQIHPSKYLYFMIVFAVDHL